MCVGFLLLCGLSAVELMGAQREHLPLGHPPSGQKSSQWKGIVMGGSQTPGNLTLPIGAALTTHVGCGIGAVADT